MAVVGQSRGWLSGSRDRNSNFTGQQFRITIDAEHLLSATGYDLYYYVVSSLQCSSVATIIDTVITADAAPDGVRAPQLFAHF